MLRAALMVALTGLALPAGLAAQVAPPRAGRPQPTRTDVLILTSGGSERGELHACVGDRCQLGSESVPLASIAWIGLQVLESQTPKVEDLDHDEVHLRDGSVHTGHLLGVSLGIVALQESSYDRGDVAWIHLAGAGEPPRPTAEVGQEAGGGQAPAPEPAPSTPPAPAPPAPSPTSGGASSGTAGSSGGGSHAVPPQPHWTRGGLWTGKANAHLDYNDQDYKDDVDLRLREYRMELYGVHGRLAGEAVALVPEGSVIHETFRGPNGSGGVCSGSGTVTVTSSSGPEDPDVSFGGNIFGRAGDDEMALSWWQEIPSGPPVYGIWVIPPQDQHYTMTCVDSQGSVTADGGYGAFDIGVWPWSPGSSSDVVLRRVEGGKMQGSYFANHRKGDWVESVSWSICREGVQCSDPPELPDSATNPCSDRDMQQAAGFVQRNRDRRAAKVAALAKAWGEYQAESQVAAEHLADYRKTIAACAAWDVTMKVLEYLVGAGAGMGLSLPADATAEEVAAFNEYKEQLADFQEAVKTLSDLTEKVMNGEAPVVLPAGDAATLEWAVKTVEKVLEMTHAASPEAMAGQLDDCGAPVPDATFQSAQQFVEHLKASLDSLDESAKLRNDIRDLDDQLPNLQYNNWAACVQHARCAGTPESDCDDLKPAGDWPDVP